MEYAHVEQFNEHLTIKIAYDSDPINPRAEYDNAGKMVWWHRRYVLGDEQPSESPI